MITERTWKSVDSIRALTGAIPVPVAKIQMKGMVSDGILSSGNPFPITELTFTASPNHPNPMKRKYGQKSPDRREQRRSAVSPLDLTMSSISETASLGDEAIAIKAGFVSSTLI